MKLNDKQLEAVNHKDGPCLVIAGAGSGKTKVLTERIVKLIESGVSPHNIIAITFTNKAANEMRERVRTRLGSLCDSIFIGTFHSFGLRILRENYKELGYEKNITILDREDENTIVKKIIKDLSLENEQYDYKYAINKISFAKNSGVDPSEFKKLYLSDYDFGIDNIYEEYEKILLRNNSVDFDDLLTLPLKLFKSNKEILEKYQERFKYILVDEYQDTNKIQYNLCNLLSKKYKNIFVVGDVDQSIFSWRNADYENILLFEKDYTNTKTIFLEENYRSTNSILKVANCIIKNNKLRKEKNLWSNRGEGEKVQYKKCIDDKSEVSFVIEKIRELIENGCTYSDFAILYRTNAQSRNIEEALLRENIPYRVFGSYFFYARKEIKDLIAYLELIHNKNNDIALERIINVPKRKIGNIAIEKLRKTALEKNISMFDAIESGKELEFKNIMLSLIEEEKNISLNDLIEDVIVKSGLKSALESSGTLEDQIRLENLEEFRSIALSNEENGIYNLEDFLANISLVSDASQYGESGDVVTLMTLHSSKGLEFKNVFMIGMEEGLFPHIRSLGDVKEIEEERRLCYVGVTRAKEKLFLTSAKRRMIYGKVTENIPSRFIGEIEEELLELIEDTVSNNGQITKKIFNMYKEKANEEFTLGSKVMHDKFGEGVIININGDIATIAFSHNVGIKTLSMKHVSLKLLN